MRKIIKGLLLAGLLAVSSQADMVRVEFGAGVWDQKVTGPITLGNITQEAEDLGLKNEQQAYAWLFVKHPIPILPNIRLEYANVDFSGEASVNGVGTLNTDVSLEQIDAILYYNILDNTLWMTVDLGLDIKYVDASFKYETAPSGVLPNFNESQEIVLPLLYARGRVELPFIAIGVEGIAKYTQYKSTSMGEFLIKADYTLVNILPIDVGLEVGYRIEQFDLDGSDFSLNTSANIDIQGVFAGAVVRF